MASDLLVSLTLKAKDTNLSATLKQVQADAAKIGPAVKSAGADASAGLAGLGNAAAAAKAALGAMGAGLSLGAIVGFARQSIEELDRLRDQAAATGVEIERLAGIKFAADLSGTSLETIINSYRQLSNAAAGAIQGQESMVEAFEQLGIQIDSLKGKRAEEIFNQVADALARTREGFTKDELASRLLGKSYRELLPLIGEGSAEFEKMIARSKELRPELKEAADAVDSVNDALREGKEAGKGFFDSMIAGASGVVKSFSALGKTISGVWKGDIGSFKSELEREKKIFEEFWDSPLTGPNKPMIEPKLRSDATKRAMEDFARDMKAAQERLTGIVEQETERRNMLTAAGIERQSAIEIAKLQLIATTYPKLWEEVERAKAAISERYAGLAKDRLEREIAEGDAYAAKVAARNQEALFRAQEAAGARIEAEEKAFARWEEIRQEMLEKNRTFGQGMSQGWREWLGSNSPFQQGMSAAQSAIDTFSNGMENLFAGLADGSIRGKDAFKQFALSVGNDITRLIARMVALQAAQAAIGLIGSAFGGGGGSFNGASWGSYGGSGFVASQSAALPEGFGMFAKSAAPSTLAGIAGSAPKTLQSGAPSAAAAAPPAPPTIINQQLTVQLAKVWDGKDAMQLIQHPDSQRAIKGIAADGLRSNLTMRQAGRTL